MPEPGAQLAIAAGFARAGIAPDVAMTALWYGRVNPGRPPRRTGDLTLDETIRQPAPPTASGAVRRPGCRSPEEPFAAGA
jgi:hypothetical protein